MTKNECKNQIFSFKIAVENYRRIVLNNENPLPHDSRTRLIETLQSQLNQEYGKLEKYTDKIGGNIGVTYLRAFGDGAYSDILGNLSSVIQNLDRIIGRLDGMPDEEFENLLKPKPAEPTKNFKNPHLVYWKSLFNSVWDWIKENKIFAGVIITVLGGLIFLFVRKWLGL